MKFGFRKPSIKKSFKARTTGRIKRTVKRSINPIYGKKGVGFIKNPERSIKNSIYHKITVDATKPIKDKFEDINPLKTKTVEKTINNKGETRMSNKKVAGIIGGIAGVTMIGARNIRWGRKCY